MIADITPTSTTPLTNGATSSLEMTNNWQYLLSATNANRMIKLNYNVIHLQLQSYSTLVQKLFSVVIQYFLYVILVKIAKKLQYDVFESTDMLDLHSYYCTGQHILYCDQFSKRL